VLYAPRIEAQCRRLTYDFDGGMNESVLEEDYMMFKAVLMKNELKFLK
jgi:hypothetical protein